MTDPIMAYSAVMRTQIERLNSIANNAGNVNSTGFLQERTSIDNNQFQQLLQSADPRTSYSISRDLKIGALNVTGAPTNLAITTDDWFQVELEGRAGTGITRNGNFSISKEGNLMLNNFKVVGASGPISNLNRDFKVHADGSIFIGEQYVDRLKLVNIKSNTSLTSLGNGVYVTDEEVVDAKDAKVVQGALVSSNVDIQTDMTKMIEISRHVEMLQRAMSAYNDLLDVGVNKIGK
jgi:flagellar basal-body rod protein FlgF